MWTLVKQWTHSLNRQPKVPSPVWRLITLIHTLQKYTTFSHYITDMNGRYIYLQVVTYWPIRKSLQFFTKVKRCAKTHQSLKIPRLSSRNCYQINHAWFPIPRKRWNAFWVYGLRQRRLLVIVPMSSSVNIPIIRGGLTHTSITVNYLGKWLKANFLVIVMT